MAYEDLLKDSSYPLDNKNYFNVIITDLKLNELYPLQFRWKYEDGSFGAWSAVKSITTVGPSVPDQPDLGSSDVSGNAGFIKVTWNGNNAASQPILNIDRVDIHIAGQSFGDGTKPAGSFKVAGTQTFVATPGSYTVQLKAYTVNGASSFFSTARIVTVTAVGEIIQTPTLPTGLTATSAPFAVSINWSGSYSGGTSFTGFKSIDIYAVSSDLGSTTTSGITDTNLVGSLTVNDIPNKINIGLDNLRQALSLANNTAAYTATIFFYYIAVNKDGTKYGSPTYTRINSSSITPTQANYVDLASGVISIENLVAGNGSFSSWLRAGTAGGARIELSAINNFTNGGYTVKKGLTAYSSGSTETLGFDLSTGALSLAGSLAATSISTSSGKFSVNSSGILTATDVDLTGLIKASSGNIGGIVIASDAIQNGSTSGSSTFRLDSAGKARFGSATGNAIIIEPSGNIYHVSDGTNASGKFTISGGNLSISGTLTASSGSSIGGWTTGSTTITGGGTTLNSNGTITVSGGSATTSLNNNGTISISAGSSGIGALNITGSGKTSELYSDALKLNAATIFESGGTSGTPAGSLTFSTSNNPRQIHFFDQNDLSGVVYINKQLSYPGISTGTGSTVVLVSGTAARIAYVSSSRKFKKNITILNSGTYLDKILQLEPVSFDWKTQPEDMPYRINYGLIAEDVSEIPVMESLVNYNENNEPISISYERLTPFLVMAIKELAARLDVLEG